MRPIQAGAATAVGLVVFTYFALSCDSTPTSNNGSGDQATIDEAGVSTGIVEVSAFVEICRPASGQMSAASATSDPSPPKLLARLLELHRARPVRSAFAPLPPARQAPPDELGDCGGRATYPSYNHSSGTTTATLEYQNYCSEDPITGNRTTLNGRLSFVETGTPGDFGPIISKFEAESPNGITETTRSASGQTLSSKLVKFEGVEQTMGVPGGLPTAGNPDRFSVTEFSAANQQTGKTYRQTDFSMTQFNTGSGGEQATISGRGYRSNGDFYTYSTSSPLTSDSDGDYTGGAITFSGEGSSTAVLNIVPGTGLQGTLTVNGTPVTDVPVCR